MSDSFAGQTKPLVMVVEDDAAIATLLRYNLEKSGYRVEEAVDGQEAVTRIAETKPDLVLLDWMLPTMSGIEVCRQIRRLRRAINADGELDLVRTVRAAGYALDTETL